MYVEDTFFFFNLDRMYSWLLDVAVLCATDSRKVKNLNAGIHQLIFLYLTQFSRFTYPKQQKYGFLRLHCIL